MASERTSVLKILIFPTVVGIIAAIIVGAVVIPWVESFLKINGVKFP